MEKVYTSPYPAIVYHIKNVLASYGIDSVIQGENLIDLAGQIPWTDAWLELWAVDDKRAQEAKEIVELALKEAELPEEVWRCPECGEELEGQFTECWKCGAKKQETQVP